MPDKKNNQDFVDWFRSSSPYIHAHRGRTLVVMFGGEVIADGRFASLAHDIATLNSLGLKLVLVHGARPQIEERLRKHGAAMRYVNGLRITDDEALASVKEAVGAVRVEIEALLSMGLANTPMAGAHMRIASGNFVTARPLGVRGGIDYCHTGEVRRIDTSGLQRRLDDGDVVLLSPLGYSPTGEVFNLSAEDVAMAAAATLKADKLLLLVEGRGVLDSRRRLVQQITPTAGEQLLTSRRKLPEEIARHLASAVQACRSGVRRAHLIDRNVEGALLQELFTRDGIGTMVTAQTYEVMRQATIDDVGGILELIKPMEDQGILVRRSRERLEMEIGYFTVVERDGMAIGCAALYPFTEERVGELACMTVHPDYRGGGRGDALLQHIESAARGMGIGSLFVLTTRTAHWFRERGFLPADIDRLPIKKRAMYNYRRNAKVFLRNLD